MSFLSFAPQNLERGMHILCHHPCCAASLNRRVSTLLILYTKMRKGTKKTKLKDNDFNIIIGPIPVEKEGLAPGPNECSAVCRAALRPGKWGLDGEERGTRSHQGRRG